jgi:hypothetical protein
MLTTFRFCFLCCKTLDHEPYENDNLKVIHFSTEAIFEK